MSDVVLSLSLSPYAGMEYVKVILKDGRMVGAILIGETDLEVMDIQYYKFSVSLATQMCRRRRVARTH